MTQTSFDLSGKVALITGAARGIGLAIATSLAANGAAVAIQDIDLDAATKAANDLRAAGGKAIALGGDMTDRNLPPKLIQQTIDQLGGLHILINNAGVQKHEPWTNVTADTAFTQWTANILAPLQLSQLVYDRFRQQKFGRIINISSIQARRGNPWMIAYSMSKAALNNLTTALSREIAADGITVNAIAPGWFDTMRNKGDFQSAADKAEKGKRIPAGRVGEPQDCAGLALLLCSDAGSYINGEVISVTGGM